MSKAEQIKRDEAWPSMPGRPNQDKRIPPGQHGQKRPDRRDQVRPDLINAEADKPKQMELQGKATALDTVIMLLDQTRTSTANSTDKLKPNQVVREHTDNKDEIKTVQCTTEWTKPEQTRAN